MIFGRRRGYPSSDRGASDLPPPPTGPAPGMNFGPDDHVVKFGEDGKPIISHPITCRIHVCPLLALIGAA